LPLDSPYSPSESVWLAPTADLAVRLRVDVVYDPLTAMDEASPGIPTLGLEALPSESRLVAEGLLWVAQRQGLAETIAGDTASFTALDLMQEADLLAVCLHDSAADWPCPGHAGIQTDGWIAEAAVFSLPYSEGRCTLTIIFDEHAPQARLRVAVGQRPFGGFRCAETPERTVRIAFHGPQRFLLLRALLAEKPAWRSDHDCIIRLQRLCLTDSQRVETVLWPPVGGI
jgi:hypothetical protein